MGSKVADDETLGQRGGRQLNREHSEKNEERKQVGNSRQWSRNNKSSTWKEWGWGGNASREPSGKRGTKVRCSRRFGQREDAVEDRRKREPPFVEILEGTNRANKQAL